MAEHSEEIGQPNPFDEHTRMWADEFDDWGKRTVPEHSEEIGMARSIEQSPWEAYEALIESIMKNADHDFWDSGGDIEAVAYVRHLEGEVERLLAENERLRESARWAVWLARTEAKRDPVA